jgi:hypothetical protein
LAARNAGPDVQVVVIDDFTPEPELRAYLAELPAHRVELLTSSRNLGFVQTVNRGFGLHPARDVVILNSDTEVADDWLGRLRQAAYSDRRVATVTPFSNNATILSYPRPNLANALPPGFDTARLDALFARTNAGATLDLPTGIGFCLYMRRDALSSLGYFDEKTFGRGYGEENDYCLRASRGGWRNLAALDTFVFHEGSVSFGAERVALQRSAQREIDTRYPEYSRLVSQFVQQDPAKPFRRRVDRARVHEDPDQLEVIASERLGDCENRTDALRDEFLRQGLALTHAQAVESELTRHLRAALGELERCRRDFEREYQGLAQALDEARGELRRATEALSSVEEDRRRVCEEIALMKRSRSWRYTSLLRRSGR